MTASATFELLRKRLATTGQALGEKVQALNRRRLDAFGRIEAKLLARLNARTEHNGVARDVVRAGDVFLLGYNVFIGLKKETQVGDVFCLYRLAESGEGPELQAQPIAGTFLDDARFVADFRELFTYYRATTLDQLRVIGERLLMIFRTGTQATDLRVFRFSIDREGRVQYLDNRGERDHVLPPTHDFEWQPVTREQFVMGRHPHANILDTVFVETIGGDLTIKIENNTESGLGIYSEPVDDKNQSLADAEIAYAPVGALILLRIKPYRENQTRYLVFNTRQKSVVRLDEIGASCMALPEDHGIVFPGGCYLESGEYKRFSDLGHDFSAFRIKRQLRAPSGEDMLYVFYEPVGGRYALLSYNVIDRALGQPLLGNGYARLLDGRVLLMTPESGEEPTRLHTMQLWRTPFAFEEHASVAPRVSGLLGRVGNATVVRALADLREVLRLASDAANQAGYEQLVRLSGRCADAYPWLTEAEAGEIGADVATLGRSAREALVACEKLEQAKTEARHAVEAAGKSVGELLSRVSSLLWQKPEDFTDAIRSIKRKRGELTLLGEKEHVAATDVASLDTRLREELDRIGARALKFFADSAAFAPLQKGLADAADHVAKATTSTALADVGKELDALAESLDGLSELVAGFEQSDAQQRADLLGRTSTLYAEVNRIRAQQRNRRETLLKEEQGLEFGAQLTVLEQTVENLLGRSDTPESTDNALAQLLGQIEQLEARFGEQPAFLVELTSRRETVLDAFAARREQIAGQREQRAQGLREAVERVLDGVPRRVARLSQAEEVHALFAGDSLVERALRQIDELRALGHAVAADELGGRLKSLREASLRDLRDRTELGITGDTLALGNFRFTVERKPLDIALLHTADAVSLRLVGSDYQRPVDDPRVHEFRAVWGQSLPNETATVYRGEYLAYRLWRAAQDGDTALRDALLSVEPDTVQALVAEHARRYPVEDYQRGVHDVDAGQILHVLAKLASGAGELSVPAAARVVAQCHYALLDPPAQTALRSHATGLAWFVRNSLAPPVPPSWLAAIAHTAQAAGISLSPAQLAAAARHLVISVGQDHPHFDVSAAAQDLADRVRSELPRGVLGALDAQLAVADRLGLACRWCEAVGEEHATPSVALEAAVILAFPAVPRERRTLPLVQTLTALRGRHDRIQDGALPLDVPEFLERLAAHADSVEPAWHAFAAVRHALVEAERQRLGLDRFLAKPLAGFVRNRLIDEVYLPLIGRNLAKQIGSADDRRSDRSGMLLLISPPGYGKTTLMEYIADRLGMTFVRINGPTLGHEATGLDPAQSPHRSASEELVKLNLGLAMATNVMLYLDDIQHLSAEFLQKFISLADATRRIDAVVDGQARTIDLRGKRFALVMAGNPYTESGDVFRIPDMLANRADVYNLGDVLSGREALFADSYIENALTANPGTAALAERPRADILSAIRAAQEDEGAVAGSVSVETIALVRRMVWVRDVLMRVNAAYVASAAQDDHYRTEPPFKLQGSYRNMTKLASALSPLMTPEELDALIRDHYRGEAQTLGARAEENLLKLGQLIGRPSAEENARWQSVCDSFRLLASQGGKDADGATRTAQALAGIAAQLEKHGQNHADAREALRALHSLDAIRAALDRTPAVEVPPALAESLTRIAKAYEETLLPLVSALHHKMTLDHDIWDQVRKMRGSVDSMIRQLGQPRP
ncbi:DNA repair ATPase [Tahibacter amnicola]|uniref:DNA repair ATPase n=1 Tax=Tahibacter amnicola TaxID=2976241 RepID=A0ABY6BE11_9GAMM|nr:DNA repair ATPase [Tahibacter amnicola]UXI68269.1 DNA repair ATPase [Tahibacter amnicola]